MSIAFRDHDHEKCARSLMARAYAHTARLGVRFTPQRQMVYEILIRGHQALGAYEILAMMNKSGDNVKPPIVYRALDFLIAAGLVHKVERRNAFVACQFPETEHQAGLLICRECDQVGEITVEGKIAHHDEFHVETNTVEAEGLCPHCKNH